MVLSLLIPAQVEWNPEGFMIIQIGKPFKSGHYRNAATSQVSSHHTSFSTITTALVIEHPW